MSEKQQQSCDLEPGVGLHGCGIHDETAAMQALINAGAPPCGTYLISIPLHARGDDASPPATCES